MLKIKCVNKRWKSKLFLIGRNRNCDYRLLVKAIIYSITNVLNCVSNLICEYVSYNNDDNNKIYTVFFLFFLYIAE